MIKLSPLNLPMRTEAIIASVILGRETTFADHDEVLTDDVVVGFLKYQRDLAGNKKLNWWTLLE